MNRKDALFVVLTTFCLCCLTFAVTPIKSGQPYDPWADMDENGKINMYDVGYMAQRFNAAGDPTKNVTVMKNGYEIQNFTVTMSGHGTIDIAPPTVFCGGYSRLSVLGDMTASHIGPNNIIRVYIFGMWWFEYAPYVSRYTGNSWDSVNENDWNMTIYGNSTDQLRSWNPPRCFITQAQAPYFQLAFQDDSKGVTTPADWWITFRIAVYMRNE